MTIEEIKEKLEARKLELLDTTDELEKIIDLIKESNVLGFETRTKTAAFLEGYRNALGEQIEWLDWFSL